MIHLGIPPEYINQIVTGDARELSKRLPDESVDLIFTDPVYDRIDDYRWLAETAARVLKPNSSALVSVGIGYLPDVYSALSSTLTYRWQLIEYRTNEVKHRHAPCGKCLYSPIVWYDKGFYRPKFVLDVRAVSVFSSTSNHEWSKIPLTTEYYLSSFSESGNIVLDLFAGGGTVPAVCKMLGRNYIAFEIDPATAERARERVRNTNPPLFVMQPEQMELI